MPIPTLLTLAALALPLRAEPDKYWLEAPDQKSAAEGSRPQVIEGVLIDQDDVNYHLRVAGGELWLPKARVVKVEKDGLTVDAIARAERQEAERRAAAKAAPATPAPAAPSTAPSNATQREGEVEPAASGPCDNGCDAGPQCSPSPRPHYDPVLHVVVPNSFASHAALLRDLELAYELTHDRAYIKMVRKLRRLQ